MFLRSRRDRVSANWRPQGCGASPPGACWRAPPTARCWQALMSCKKRALRATQKEAFRAKLLGPRSTNWFARAQWRPGPRLGCRGTRRSRYRRKESLGAARLADDELAGQNDLVPPVGAAPLDAFEEQLRSERAERLRRLFHRSQKRIEPRRVLDVVEADERDVVRDLEPGGAHRFDRADRGETVDREHGRWSFLELEQPAH